MIRVSLKSLRARASRTELQLLMGGVCQSCSAANSLEFDCYPVPETSHHFMPWPQKMRFYWQQFLKQNLRLLCRRCHQRETVRMNHKCVHVSLIPSREPQFAALFVSNLQLQQSLRALADSGVRVEVLCDVF